MFFREYKTQKPSRADTFRLAPLARQHPRYRGCIGHWMINEGGGTKLYDLSGYGNVGNWLDDNPIWTLGNFGYCLSFNANDSVVISSKSLFDVDHITVTAWVVPNTTAGFGQAVARDDETNRCWGLGLNGAGDFRFVVFISNTQINAANTGGFSIGGLYHLAGTYDGSNLRLYVNGILRATTVQSGVIDKDTVDIGIGTRIKIPPHDSQRFWNGLIVDTRIYNRALAPSEIQSHYTDPFLEFDQARRLGRFVSVLNTSIIVPVATRLPDPALEFVEDGEDIQFVEGGKIAPVESK